MGRFFLCWAVAGQGITVLDVRCGMWGCFYPVFPLLLGQSLAILLTIVKLIKVRTHEKITVIIIKFDKF